MSVQSHLSELEKRHRAVERELEVAQRLPATPDDTLSKLKRKKLQLKDEITRLQAKTSAAANGSTPSLH